MSKYAVSPILEDKQSPGDIKYAKISLREILLAVNELIPISVDSLTPEQFHVWLSDVPEDKVEAVKSELWKQLMAGECLQVAACKLIPVPHGDHRLFSFRHLYQQGSSEVLSVLRSQAENRVRAATKGGNQAVLTGTEFKILSWINGIAVEEWICKTLNKHRGLPESTVRKMALQVIAEVMDDVGEECFYDTNKERSSKFLTRAPIAKMMTEILAPMTVCMIDDGVCRKIEYAMHPWRAAYVSLAIAQRNQGFLGKFNRVLEIIEAKLEGGLDDFIVSKQCRQKSNVLTSCLSGHSEAFPQLSLRATELIDRTSGGGRSANDAELRGTRFEPTVLEGIVEVDEEDADEMPGSAEKAAEGAVGIEGGAGEGPSGKRSTSKSTLQSVGGIAAEWFAKGAIWKVLSNTLATPPPREKGGRPPHTLPELMEHYNSNVAAAVQGICSEAEKKKQLWQRLGLVLKDATEEGEVIEESSQNAVAEVPEDGVAERSENTVNELGVHAGILTLTALEWLNGVRFAALFRRARAEFSSQPSDILAELSTFLSDSLDKAAVTLFDAPAVKQDLLERVKNAAAKHRTSGMVAEFTQSLTSLIRDEPVDYIEESSARVAKIFSPWKILCVANAIVNQDLDFLSQFCETMQQADGLWITHLKHLRAPPFEKPLELQAKVNPNTFESPRFSRLVASDYTHLECVKELTAGELAAILNRAPAEVKMKEVDKKVKAVRDERHWGFLGVPKVGSRFSEGTHRMAAFRHAYMTAFKKIQERVAQLAPETAEFLHAEPYSEEANLIRTALNWVNGRFCEALLNMTVDDLKGSRGTSPIGPINNDQPPTDPTTEGIPLSDLTKKKIVRGDESSPLLDPTTPGSSQDAKDDANRALPRTKDEYEGDAIQLANIVNEVMTTKKACDLFSFTDVYHPRVDEDYFRLLKETSVNLGKDLTRALMRQDLSERQDRLAARVQHAMNGWRSAYICYALARKDFDALRQFSEVMDEVTRQWVAYREGEREPWYPKEPHRVIAGRKRSNNTTDSGY
eukprot:Blabericola_migrator_1__8012@NODE_410_length_8738_cov_113_985353_g323_i0_p2_GENE_NODE_410_length_8738_cov_113_985353_g323_i0NODE_410_length_8738_cov_113_985353_g323_i0_p2_ORF_typecomplete_len1026_score168_15_NODE_410_length_8738_cov_113_985353_g323_i054938570